MKNMELEVKQAYGLVLVPPHKSNVTLGKSQIPNLYNGNKNTYLAKLLGGFNVCKMLDKTGLKCSIKGSGLLLLYAHVYAHEFVSKESNSKIHNMA